MRVLIVEDEHKLALILRRALCEQGLAADVAQSGEEALTMAGATAYDTIVLDVCSPESMASRRAVAFAPTAWRRPS